MSQGLSPRRGSTGGPSNQASHPRACYRAKRHRAPDCTVLHFPRLPTLLRTFALLTAWAIGLIGCGTSHGTGPTTLRISEVMPSNDGAYVDSEGETDDYVELVNVGAEPVSLVEFSLADESGNSARLPDEQLQPGAVFVVTADDEEEQGAEHMPFKLSASGETLALRYHGVSGTVVVDEVSWEDAEANDSFARFTGALSEPLSRCRWASPGRANGDTCGPTTTVVGPPIVNEFAPYTWAQPRWPEGLVISEVALQPARFVELRNTTSAPITLDDKALRLAPHGPNQPWPTASGGAAILVSGSIAPGERRAFVVPDSVVTAAGLGVAFEGVVSLYAADGSVLDRVDFMRWPAGASLARDEARAVFAFYETATEAAANDATVLSSRDVGGYVRHLYTPGDFVALSGGGTQVGLRAAKFIADMNVAGGPLAYIMTSSSFALHYDFVHQVFDGQPAFDRCDPAMDTAHRAGWRAFSNAEYFCGETNPPQDRSCTDDERRFMMSTYVHHVGVDMHTIEMVSGDRASPDQMRDTFFLAARVTDDATRYTMRPQSEAHVTKLRMVEGQLPIIDTNAPFVGVTFQALNPAVAYGTLRFVPGTELDGAELGLRTILITDLVPNDIGFVGAVITEALQTPLSHINVLSQNRGTPNMALAGARSNAAITPHLDTLVRLEVTEGAFEIRPADLAEAQAFWDSLRPDGPLQEPALDLTVRGVQPLLSRSFTDVGSIGGKAAQFAELYRIAFPIPSCGGRVARVPQQAFAIPMVHFVEHMAQSGAQSILDAALADARFSTDPVFRSERLAAVRAAITEYPVEPVFLAEVEDAIVSRFGDVRVRLRSSSNTEDLDGFNGAGLYESHGARVRDDDRGPGGDVEGALVAVWASLWTDRAHDERDFFRINPARVAMGVLVHTAFDSEEGAGIVVSRSVNDPIRSDVYTVNLQRGEARVANPAPGVASEQFDYRWGRTPRRVFRTYSTFSPEQSLVSEVEACGIAEAVRAIHNHFRGLVDPDGTSMYYAMEVEIKLADGDRALFVKQARPYPFATALLPTDCRGF